MHKTLKDAAKETLTGVAETYGLAFPPHLLFSSDHTDPRWRISSHRRLKNVLVLLEWLPTGAAAPAPAGIAATASAPAGLSEGARARRHPNPNPKPNPDPNPSPNPTPNPNPNPTPTPNQVRARGCSAPCRCTRRAPAAR